MTIENAIILLSKRAEYAQQKADSPDKKRKADDYVEIVNTVIEYYNNTEKLPDTIRNLQELVKMICDYIGVSAEDTERLLRTDAQFIHRRLLYWKEQYPDRPILLLHRVAFDCYAIYEAECSLRELNEKTIPHLEERDMKEQTKLSYNILRAAEKNRDGLEDIISDL